MIRIILWNAFLFILPFIMTALWARWLDRNHPPASRIRYIAMSSAIGTVLVLASLLTWRLMSGDEPDKNYVPPKVEDGAIVPGHFE